MCRRARVYALFYDSHRGQLVAQPNGTRVRDPHSYDITYGLISGSPGCTPRRGRADPCRPTRRRDQKRGARSKCREPVPTADDRASTFVPFGRRHDGAWLGFEAAGGANRVSSGLPSTQVTTAHRTTRTTGGRPRGSMPRSHRPTRHTSALRPTLPPTPGRGLGVEVAQSMPRSSTHPDHAASPPLSLCRLEMAPSIQYSFCTARCDA